MTLRAGYTCALTIRATPQERRHLCGLAREAGLSLSRYLVLSALAGPPPASAEDRALRQRAIFHARKIGVNLNQIARQLNSGAALSEGDLREALLAATDALQRLGGKAGA